ncbi:MAG TPA: HD domain-containing protein [Dissulfurispiraceae bacterium]|nr:HD domain-containing protein [Dissulfurispiraceae bacterium]
MLRKPLLLKIFDAANMQRWNDKIRPVELRELDKQAHKMVIAYLIGKFEEDQDEFDWIEVIEGGLFEFLQRLIVTDLKPQIFYEIKKDDKRYAQLNKWVYEQLEHLISPLGDNFCRRFRDYFADAHETLCKRILGAAHFYATKWEFDIIERTNPNGYEIPKIKKDLQEKQEKYYDLKGMQQIALYPKFRDFIDLCGELRFQLRWSHINRVPKTSVLGHMLIVAIFSYLFSCEIDACRKRRVNNYFSGLFHDFPEVLTRDIISPVKRSIAGLEELVKEYERDQMEKEVYGLIPEAWHGEMRMFTEDEFSCIVTIDGMKKKTTSEEINDKYNSDDYNPRDGELLKATDELAAFIEAYMALGNGLASQDLQDAKNRLMEKYKQKVIAGIKFGELYADFM